MTDRTRRQRRRRYNVLRRRGEIVLRVVVNRALLGAAMAETGLLHRDERGDRERLAARLGYVTELWIRSVLGTRSAKH